LSATYGTAKAGPPDITSERAAKDAKIISSGAEAQW